MFVVRQLNKKIYPSTVRKWRKSYERIKEEAEKSPQKISVHRGRPRHHEELESEVYDWIKIQREAEFAVSTTDIIDKALSINPQFKEAINVTLTRWVCRFMARHSLSVRTRIRVSQVTAAAM